MRVSAKPLGEYPWYLRPFFWNQKRKYGQVLLPGLLWARVPPLFAAVALLYGAFERRRARVDPVLRALVTARVSQINWCRFCMDINAFLLTRRTGSMEKAEALAGWRGSDLFSAKEKVVLEYVEAITCTERQVDDDLMDTPATVFRRGRRRGTDGAGRVPEPLQQIQQRAGCAGPGVLLRTARKSAGTRGKDVKPRSPVGSAQQREPSRADE